MLRESICKCLLHELNEILKHVDPNLNNALYNEIWLQRGTCMSGVTIRMSVSKISELGRATQGVKLIRLDEGDKIAAITQLDESKMEDPEMNDADTPAITDADIPENPESEVKTDEGETE